MFISLRAGYRCCLCDYDGGGGDHSVAHKAKTSVLEFVHKNDDDDNDTIDRYSGQGQHRGEDMGGHDEDEIRTRRLLTEKVGGKAASLMYLYDSLIVRRQQLQRMTDKNNIINGRSKNKSKRLSRGKGSQNSDHDSGCSSTSTSTSSSSSKDLIPRGYVLTVDFFREWIDMMQSEEDKVFAEEHRPSMNGGDHTRSLAQRCKILKDVAKKLPLSTEQVKTLIELKKRIQSWQQCSYVAVRSSAPEEDGMNQSFAGMFETKLGVRVNPDDPNSNILEDAIRDCFASRYDARVYSYYNNNQQQQQQQKHKHWRQQSDNAVIKKKGSGNGFACIVMEMVDSIVSGAAFSTNPLNSDLDELVIDSCYGLGESVVDGTVDVDHFVYNKINQRIIEQKIGHKEYEKRMRLGKEQQEQVVSESVTKKTDDTAQQQFVEICPVDDLRQKQSSLTEAQIGEVADLVCSIEDIYRVPVDVEWAYTTMQADDGGSDDRLGLKLLQARPITTNFVLDEHMITKPGERRMLYYDFNIASEATTTKPFTHLDMKQYVRMVGIFMGTPKVNWYPEDPRMPMFSASTRQYCNLSLFFRYFSPEYFSKEAQLLDPYLSDLFASKDCDRDMYRIRSAWRRKKGVDHPWPKEVNMRNTIWLMRQVPFWSWYKINRDFLKDIEQSKKELDLLVQESISKVDQVHLRGIPKEGGVAKYIEDLLKPLMECFNIELALILLTIAPLFSKLDKERREGKNDRTRQEYDALCGGYEGDALIEINSAIYQLAQSLPESVWNEYEYDTLDKLAERIQDNVKGIRSDLPTHFLKQWTAFMNAHGTDGQEQLFISSPRYNDSPEVLLAIMMHNVGDTIQDPAAMQQKNAEKRRAVMALHEERARKKWYEPNALKTVKTRNQCLEHLMCIRNSPKIHMSRVVGLIHQTLLKVEQELLQCGRLEEAGDIFHLDIEEIDKAVAKREPIDLKELVRPRKALYEKALRSNQCPMLIDSRNRILRPDVKLNQEPGVLIGTAISPGIATGRVRVVERPTDPMEPGEVLATRVTDPAWTPMFVGASAVILQVGGVLQHGALCAREYSKPAVSGIDVMTLLKTGMLVSVDGNTGVLKILEVGKESE